MVLTGRLSIVLCNAFDIAHAIWWLLSNVFGNGIKVQLVCFVVFFAVYVFDAYVSIVFANVVVFAILFSRNVDVVVFFSWALASASAFFLQIRNALGYERLPGHDWFESVSSCLARKQLDGLVLSSSSSTLHSSVPVLSPYASCTIFFYNGSWKLHESTCDEMRPKRKYKKMYLPNASLQAFHSETTGNK